MATGARVVSTRFSEEEYQALRSLSTIEDESINQIIRSAVHAYVASVVGSEDFEGKVSAAKERATRADETLKQRLGLAATSDVRVSVEAS